MADYRYHCKNRVEVIGLERSLVLLFCVYCCGCNDSYSCSVAMMAMVAAMVMDDTAATAAAAAAVAMMAMMAIIATVARVATVTIMATVATYYMIITTTLLIKLYFFRLSVIYYRYIRDNIFSIYVKNYIKAVLISIVSLSILTHCVRYSWSCLFSKQ